MPDKYIIDNKEWDFPDPEGNDFVDSKLIDKEFTENGTYNTEDEPGDINGYKEVTVNVEGGGTPPILIEKSVTENGMYNASDDEADGYSSVTVNVAGGKQYGAFITNVSKETITTSAEEVVS